MRKKIKPKEKNVSEGSLDSRTSEYLKYIIVFSLASNRIRNRTSCGYREGRR